MIGGGAAKRTLYAAGYYGSRLRGDAFPGLVILCYHSVRETGDREVPFAELHVTTTRLAEHCRLLAASCHPVSLEDVRRAGAGGAPLPARAVLVTFDDGYRSVLTRALPVLERFAVPAAVFACSEPVAQQQLLWYDAIARRSGDEAALRAKYLPYDEWRRACALAVTPAAATDPHAPMTIDELRRLSRHPLIEIGAHTATHPILAQAPLEVQRVEVEGCRSALREWTGTAVTAFAYPNGRRGSDYSDETVAIVARAGCDLAFTTADRFNLPGEPSLERSRFVQLDTVSAAELAHRLTYSWRRDAVPA